MEQPRDVLASGAQQPGGEGPVPQTRKEYLTSIGVTTFNHAYEGIYWPCVVHVPRDLMHVELEGTLKAHLIGVFYMAMRKLKWFSLAQLNAALKYWPFPVGKRPPRLVKIPTGVC